MKKSFVKRLLSVGMAVILTMASLAGCGTKETNSTDTAQKAETAKETKVTEGKGGTIMWLSNLSSGIQYETTVSYLTEICTALGYDFTVVYGDGFNDAAGNLSVVKNNMTSDVVGIIASQDGGLASIMEEYPEIYMVGYNTEMNSVYGEGGENAACLENDRFLGTISDGFFDGAKMGEQYAQAVIDKGYKKVSVIQFPAYAYPNQTAAAEAFYASIEEYNGTSDEPIEIVGESLVLEFSPLEESYFLEDGYNDLDAIVALCAGVQFVYPTIVSAIGNGNCSPDTKMITGGFDTDESIIADIGDEGIISWLSISPSENPAFSIVLLDNAINGVQFSDWTNDRIDSLTYVIDSTEDIENVMNKSMTGTGDVTKAQLTVEEVVNLCARNNPDATYQGLVDILHDESKMSVDSLKDK